MNNTQVPLIKGAATEQDPQVLKYGEMYLRRGSAYIREIGNPSYGSCPDSFYKDESGMLITSSNGRGSHTVESSDFLALESGGVCFGHVPVNEAFQDAPEIFGDIEFNKIYVTLSGNINRRISLLLKLFHKIGLRSELDKMRIESGNQKVIESARKINQYYSSRQYLEAIIGAMKTEVASLWNKNEAKDTQVNQLEEFKDQLQILDDLKMYCAKYVHLGLKNSPDMEKPRYKIAQDLVRDILYSSVENTTAFENMMADIDKNVRLPEDDDGDDTDFVDALRRLIHPAAQFYTFAKKVCDDNSWGDPTEPEILVQRFEDIVNIYPLKDFLLEEITHDSNKFNGSLLVLCSDYLRSQRE